MNKNIAIPKFARGGFIKPLYIGGDNQEQTTLEEDINKALEKVTLKEINNTFDELRGLK